MVIEQPPSQSLHKSWPTFLLTLAQLVRLPAGPSAVADVLAGFWIAAGSINSAPLPMLALLASLSLYFAGMILNDVYDVDEDRRERPYRPIPSGKVRWRFATWFGVAFMLAGLCFSYLAGSTVFEVGLLLAFLIILYDGGLKQTLLGPTLMGLCRFFNVLIGIAGFVESRIDTGRDLHNAIAVAACNGLYILGVTIVAKNESSESKRETLLAGLLIMLAAAMTHVVIVPIKTNSTFAAAIVLAGIALWRFAPIIRSALLERTPGKVQTLVKWSLFGLIIMNGLTVMSHVGFLAGLIILSLTIPAMLVGRWLYAT